MIEIQYEKNNDIEKLQEIWKAVKSAKHQIMYKTQ
jgi:hypothetical protein